VEEEVKTTKMEIQVRTIELEMGTKPLIVVHVEITKTIVDKIDVFEDKIQSTEGVMLRGLDDYMILDEQTFRIRID
jgi:hypothetical protein